MAEDKVKAVLEWEVPKSLKELQSILGFANFYRHFIKDYSKVARLLTESTKGDKNDCISKKNGKLKYIAFFTGET